MWALWMIVVTVVGGVGYFTWQQGSDRFPRLLRRTGTGVLALFALMGALWAIEAAVSDRNGWALGLGTAWVVALAGLALLSSRWPALGGVILLASGVAPPLLVAVLTGEGTASAALALAASPALLAGLLFLLSATVTPRTEAAERPSLSRV